MLSTSNGQWIIALTIICQVVVSGTCSIHSVLPSVGIPPFPGKRCTVQCTSWQPFHCTVHSQMAVREGAWNDPLHHVGSSTTVLGVVALGCLPQRKHQCVHGAVSDKGAPHGQRRGCTDRQWGRWQLCSGSPSVSLSSLPGCHMLFWGFVLKGHSNCCLQRHYTLSLICCKPSQLGILFWECFSSCCTYTTARASFSSVACL